MKKYATILFVLAAASCGPSRSDQMNSLVKQKKVLTDSIRYYRGYESFFNGKAREMARTAHDSLQYKPMTDSQARYSELALKNETTLKEIDFSIDSLSKLK